MLHGLAGQSLNTWTRSCWAAALGNAIRTAANQSQRGFAFDAHIEGSVDKKEAAKFAQLSDAWWSTAGPFGALHKLNPARVKFVRDAVCDVRGIQPHQPAPFNGLQVLDVGCGGGLLSESLARLGANTRGIDVVPESLEAARIHAALDPIVKVRTRYDLATIEEVARQGTTYDVVVASEVIEHVPNPQAFVKALATTLKANGCLVVTSLSRTLLSHLLSITVAENVLGWVPRGTHDWTKYLTPDELTLLGMDNNLKLVHMCGLSLDLVSGLWHTSNDVRVNYCAAFVRHAVQDAAVS